MVQRNFANFAPPTHWECDQTVGEAVVVPNGWWYQTYDDDKTMSVSAKYGGTLLSSSAAVPTELMQWGAPTPTVEPLILIIGSLIVAVLLVSTFVNIPSVTFFLICWHHRRTSTIAKVPFLLV